MDHILTAKIYNFLQLKEPTEEQIIEGATLLLRCNPGKERGVYNNALSRPRQTLPWIRTDLKKYYDIRKRGLTTPEVEKFNNETVAKVEQTLSVVPEGVVPEIDNEGEEKEDTIPVIPILGTRGIRPDHDKLPEEIQAIWERNSERWRKMRSLHAQLAAMIARQDYAPCDGNELCYMLRQVDTELRNDYDIYDSYSLDLPEKKNDAPAEDSVEVFTDNVKTIQNARTVISRGLSRKKALSEDALKNIQDAVNTLAALKQSLKDKTVERLKELGIAVPDNMANA